MTDLTRRLRAAELFERGWSQARVARELEVSRTTTMRWHRVWRRDGRAGLARVGHPGRPKKLDARELTSVLRELPRTWSVDRIALELERRTGIHYHPGHVWRILEGWGFGVVRAPSWQLELRDPDGHPIVLMAPVDYNRPHDPAE